MTPLEHFREAERLLTDTAAYDPCEPHRQHLVAMAQVHATLANAHMTAGVWEEK